MWTKTPKRSNKKKVIYAIQNFFVSILSNDPFSSFLSILSQRKHQFGERMMRGFPCLYPILQWWTNPYLEYFSSLRSLILEGNLMREMQLQQVCKVELTRSKRQLRILSVSMKFSNIAFSSTIARECLVNYLHPLQKVTTYCFISL